MELSDSEDAVNSAKTVRFASRVQVRDHELAAVRLRWDEDSLVRRTLDLVEALPEVREPFGGTKELHSDWVSGRHRGQYGERAAAQPPADDRGHPVPASAAELGVMLSAGCQGAIGGQRSRWPRKDQSKNRSSTRAALSLMTLSRATRAGSALANFSPCCLSENVALAISPVEPDTPGAHCG
jgi:hypothetical protein